MSEVFYEKFMSFMLGFLVLTFMVLIASEFLFYYTTQGNIIFYYGYIITVTALCLYGIRYYLSFRNFKENLYLLIPNPNSEKPIEPLNMDLNNKALEVCLYYRNGATLSQIERNLGLTHGTQMRRLMRKGLDILLRSYNEHNEKKVEAHVRAA